MGREKQEVMEPILHCLREHGWWAQHLSPSSITGYPDIDAAKGQKYLRVECKDATGESPSVRMASLFTKYQFPWMIKYLTLGGSNLFVVIKHGECFYDMRVQNIDDVTRLLDWRLDHFLETQTRFFTACTMVENWESEF
jgi:Holliday junction resolvase